MTATLITRPPGTLSLAEAVALLDTNLVVVLWAIEHGYIWLEEPPVRTQYYFGINRQSVLDFHTIERFTNTKELPDLRRRLAATRRRNDHHGSAALQSIINRFPQKSATARHAN